MKKLLLILVILCSLLSILGANLVGEIPTYYISGKGFYVDKSGVKHAGKLKFYYTIFHESGEVSNRNVVYKGEGEKRELAYEEIKYFVIKKEEYYPREEFSFTTYSPRNNDLIKEYILKKVFVQKVVVGRISYYTTSAIIGGGVSQRNWDVDIIEKEGELFHVNLCAKDKKKSKMDCLLELIKDQPKLYEKYKRRSKFTPFTEASMKYIFEDYNSF
jgi:hypothetical protein